MSVLFLPGILPSLAIKLLRVGLVKIWAEKTSCQKKKKKKTIQESQTKFEVASASSD